MIAFAAPPFHSPNLDYARLSPLLIVFGVALVGVLVEAFAPRERRYLIQSLLAGAGLVAGFIAVVAVGLSISGNGGLGAGSFGTVEAGGAIAVDGPSLFMLGHVAGLVDRERHAVRRASARGRGLGVRGAAAALPGTEAEREASARGMEHTEIFPLMMFAVGGMMLFPARPTTCSRCSSRSRSLAAAVPAVRAGPSPAAAQPGSGDEVLPARRVLLGVLPLRRRVGLRLRRKRSGSPRSRDAISSHAGANGILLVGIGLVAVGLLFKVGAAPFHAWTPDVYQGAPTAVTAFMAACTKVAAFGALLRLFYVALGGARWDWQPMLWVVAILTMVVGSMLAITQTDIKRMLAYSSIAHAGFLLTGFVGATQGVDIIGHQITDVCRPCCSTWWPTASRRSARSPSSRSCAMRAARRRTCPAGQGSARSRRSWPGCSPSSCSASPASR